MKRITAILAALCLLLTAAPALGDEVFTVQDINGASYESDQEYLRISCPVEGESRVTVTIADENGSITYQRDYGLCSGTFRSEDIYLRLNGAETLYNISVSTGESTSSFQVNRTMPRLQGNAACAVGYPLSDLSGTGGWKTATILDVNALRGSSLTVPMHASGAYTLGSVTFSVRDGMLTVDADIAQGVDGEIDRATVYVATNPIDAQNLGTKSFGGASGSLGEAISLNGTDYAAVYVKLTVSFDPSGVPGSPDTWLDGQQELWQQMQLMQTGEAVG